MPNCTAGLMSFGRLGRCHIEANFEGGALSSDGGLMLLRQVDRHLGLSKAVADALHDPRNQDRIVHETPALYSASKEILHLAGR